MANSAIMQKLLSVIIIGFFALSCEKDSLVIEDSPQENLKSNVSLTNKLSRVAQHPTTFDNIADNTSCFAIGLPATIIANNQSVVINSPADYQQIATILNANANDTDSVAIQFPITIIYADYSTREIANMAALTAAISGCSGSIELSCMSVSFPIQVVSYDSLNQIADTITLGNTEALFQFLSTIANYDAVSLVYPISFNAPNGSVLTIENNDQLEVAIDSYTAECLAAFIPVPNPNPATELEDIIVDGSWYISYYFDNSNQTSQYAAFDFTFTANGNLTATNGSGSTSGTWEEYMDSGEQKLEFTFSNSDLQELEEDWTVISFTETTITMEHESGGGGNTDYLTLQKN